MHIAFRFEYLSVTLITKYFLKSNFLVRSEKEHEAEQTNETGTSTPGEMS